jgi:hypothetical protein
VSPVLITKGAALMLRPRIWKVLCVLGLASLILPATWVLAGPPLICHEIKVPEGTSLPWGKEAFDKASGYKVANVVDDTLKALSPEAQILVRMETLRRATLYIDRKQSSADELLGRLMARALDAEAVGKPDAMAWFDAGYLVQCLHQTGTATSFGPAVTKGAGATAIGGYSWVARAIAIAGSNGELELAAALMTVDHRVPEHEQHLKRALASNVAQGSPEAERLLEWIAQIDGTSIESLRAKHGLTDARRGG